MVAFPKIEIKWDWIYDVHIYIKSDAVIWFWQYCHVRTRQTSENQITDHKCVVQTNSRVKWGWFYSGMSEFNCLVVVLFSAMFSCFLLDSFELQEMVCVTKHGATFSSLNISRRYDEHACDTIFFPLCWKLKNQSLKSIVITFCKKRLSCDRVIKRGLANIWAHKHAAKRMVSVNNCCLQFFNSRAVFESPFL